MAKGSNFEREISKELSLWASDNQTDAIFWRSEQSGGRATIRAKHGLKTPNSAGDIAFIDPIGKPLLDVFVLELKKGYGGKKKLKKQVIKDLISDITFYKTSDKKEQKTIISNTKQKLTLKQKQTWNSKKGGFDYCEYIMSKIYKEINRSKDSGRISVLDIVDSDTKNNILIDWVTKVNEEAVFHEIMSWMVIFRRDNRKKCVMLPVEAFNILNKVQRDNFIFINKFIKVNMKSGIGEVYIFDYIDFFKWLDFKSIKQVARGT